ncbi:MAG: hypothetical protein JSV10_07475 [Candidatus Zixiibacteriota bacterium]|nr:MAG: hypothetical protein JSV10_07475 [candidate division Zixibacteria bacterium]
MTLPEVRKPFFDRWKARSILRILLALLFVQLATLGHDAIGQTKESEDENPPSNEEFLRQSVRSLFERTFDDFPEAGSHPVFLQAEREHPANWLLEDELVSYLLSMKYQVALRSSEPEGNSREFNSLFYRIIEMRLDYPEVRRKGLLGGRMVSRRASLNLSFRLEGGAAGRVLWTKRGQEENSDLVKRSRVKSINNDSYPILNPSLPDDPQSRFLEPALVAVVVGGLIYLFFASR